MHVFWFDAETCAFYKYPRQHRPIPNLRLLDNDPLSIYLVNNTSSFRHNCAPESLATTPSIPVPTNGASHLRAEQPDVAYWIPSALCLRHHFPKMD